MSRSNKLAVVFPIKRTDSPYFSNKNKGSSSASAALPVNSDDESPASFAKMSKAEREKLKQDLFKCYPESYIKDLRGASSGYIGYMSQLGTKVYCPFRLYLST